MVRTQIQLTEGQARKLRKRAREQGISLAEAIRRCVDHELANSSPDLAALYKQAQKLVGVYRDREGAGDVAVNHDRYLDEAYR